MDISNTFKDIPTQRLLLYLVILGIFPFLAALFFFWSGLDRVNELEYTVQNAHELALKVERKQAANIATANSYRNADHFYIDKNLETLHFLVPEVDALTKVIENPNFIEDESTRKRFEFLKGKQNQLTFAESNVQTHPFFQEVTETLLHPVEINQTDLQQILTLIEGRDIGPFKAPQDRPQLILLNFKIDKKSIREKSEVYELSMKVLKREFS
ncbi:MAG: hypothetical protein H0T62_00580 [Parachlamydiaceae bacterium]|nr:hypothetical protein [Parachlamydiaceae bacterium]